MTIAQAISGLHLRRPGNEMPNDEAVRLLSRLDGMIVTEIIETHEEPVENVLPYDEETSEDTILLAPAPYDAVYLSWLEAQTDYLVRDFDAYQNSMAVFAEDYKALADWYHRTHTPKTTHLRYF